MDVLGVFCGGKLQMDVLGVFCTLGGGDGAFFTRRQADLAPRGSRHGLPPCFLRPADHTNKR
jgi:hypothetical protein